MRETSDHGSEQFAAERHPRNPSAPDASFMRLSGFDNAPGQKDWSSTACQQHLDVGPHPVEPPVIPKYRVLAELARGGMGRVYAGHDLTLDREVAIKTLLPGADAERFITEATIAARLPHPGIPPVYALGTLDDGTPWLAMKRIRGETLAHLLARRQPMSARADELPRYLQIFEQIAQAIGFAHSRGVIHRDLKPSNVMVGEFGEVQVMDWGLAKESSQDRERPAPTTGPRDVSAKRFAASLGHQSGDSSATTADHAAGLTAAGTVVGTPGYMAPEQARGELVDARADVFALGSILTEILTGQPALVGLSAQEALTKTAVGDLTEVFDRLNACLAEIDEELIALCKRCLAFNPEERPVDGREVAAEMATYRATVEARMRQAETAAAAAVVREAEQRKRRQFTLAAGASIAAVLFVGLAVSHCQMNRAIHAEQQALDNEEKERRAKIEAESQRQRAEAAAEKERLAKEAETRERKYAQAIAAFVKEDFLALTSVEGQNRFRGEGLDRNASLLDLLNRGAEKLRERKDLDPRIEAELSWIIGVNYRGAGEAAKGLSFLERAVALRRQVLGEEHEDTLHALNSLAVCYSAAGQLDKALPLDEKTLRLRKAKLGPDHPDTLASMNNLACCYQSVGQLARALPLFEETVRLRKAKLGPYDPETLISMNNLAFCYQSVGQLAKALPLYEETLKLMMAKLGPDHSYTLSNMNNLAGCYQRAGQLDKALSLFEESFQLKKAKLGPDHPDTLTSMNNLAMGYEAAGQLDRALPLYEETLRLRKAKLGPDHPDTLNSMNNLAACFWSMQQLDKSVPLFEQLLPIQEKKLGRGHPSTQTTVANLGVNYKDAGRVQEAFPLLEEAHQAAKTHADLRWVAEPLLDAYAKAGRKDKLAKLLQEQLSQARRDLPSDSPKLAGRLAQIGLIFLEQQQWTEAEEFLRECLAIREKKEPDAWTTFNTMSMLGGAWLGQKKYAEAEPLLLKGYEGIKARLPQSPGADPAQVSAIKQRLAEALDRVITLYIALEKPDELRKWQAEKEKLQAEAASSRFPTHPSER